MATTDGPALETEQVNNYERHHKKLQFMLVAALVLMIVFAIGALAGHAASRLQSQRIGGYNSSGPGGGMMRGYNANGSGFGMGNQSSNLVRLKGVVTSVNGSTIVIAGDGTTNSITTNTSTQYTGGSQAATNDTIIVFGTTNNGVFTAARVIINPPMP